MIRLFSGFVEDAVGFYHVIYNVTLGNLHVLIREKERERERERGRGRLSLIYYYQSDKIFVYTFTYFFRAELLRRG